MTTEWLSRPLISLHLDVPIGDRGAGEEAGDVFAHGDRLHVLAEEDVGWVFGGAQRDRLGDRLLTRRDGLLGESVAQPLEFAVARPAEHRLVAAGVEEAGRD